MIDSGRRIANAAAFFCLGLSIGPAPAGEPAAPLPDPACVQLLRRARVAEMRDDVPAALALLRQAVQAHPQELVVATALWEFNRHHELSAEDLATAERMMTDVLTDPQAPLHLATLLHVAALPDLGTEQLLRLRQAVERRSTAENAPAQVWDVLAMLCLRLDDREAARKALHSRLAAEANDLTRWQLVALERELGDWDAAETQLRELNSREDVSPFVQMSLAEAVGRVGNFGEVTAILDRLDEAILIYDVHVRKTRRDLLVQVAWDFRDAGKDDYAEAIFRRVLAIDAKDREALLAVLYLYSSPAERQRYEDMLREQRVGESDPDRLLDDGARLLAAGNAAEAFELLQRAAFALPDSEAAWYNLGLAALKLERWETAEQAYREAARLNPARVDAVLNHAVSLAHLERCAQAVPVLESVRGSAPDNTAALYWLYFCHDKLGNVEATAEYRRLYLAAQPK